MLFSIRLLLGSGLVLAVKLNERRDPDRDLNTYWSRSAIHSLFSDCRVTLRRLAFPFHPSHFPA